ncbi:MAG: hypothetical protein NC311_18115 [Muribaculaceae bacterium]|nr:hypothetical protein [Muribaculaceae bacterium]
MWEHHKMRFEEFLALPMTTRALYIASAIVHSELVEEANKKAQKKAEVEADRRKKRSRKRTQPTTEKQQLSFNDIVEGAKAGAFTNVELQNT